MKNYTDGLLNLDAYIEYKMKITCRDKRQRKNVDLQQILSAHVCVCLLLITEKKLREPLILYYYRGLPVPCTVDRFVRSWRGPYMSSSIH